MATNNPYRLGELSKLYVVIDDDIDTTQTDTAILALADWDELCLVSATKNMAVTTRQIKDRCSAKKIKSAYGRSEISINITLNSFRMTATQRKELYLAIENHKQVAVLMLTDDKSNDQTYGIVGNFIIESADEEQPEEGNNTESFVLKESAISEYDARAIYGSAFV